ncbi:NHL repeat-containing protein [Rhodohalobacter halophilus]|uniref:hypothetical protein n=1 Tax=Rhodohalobacter halophilus TaxID=1812810 RepID=UPI0015B37FE2|nr:hypothetical protein [Rhodohalobacter halophilus]
MERPDQFMQTDHAGNIYFDHLNYATTVKENGNIIVNDRPQAVIMEINPDGELVDLIATKGQGPGEIQDASRLSAGIDESLVIFDQRNYKIVQYDLNEASHYEFLPFQPDQYRIRSAHALHEPDLFLVVEWKPSALSNPGDDFTNRFVIYNQESDSVLARHTYPDRIFARQIIDGAVRGGAPVPFSPALHFSTSSNNKSIYISWSENNEIVELNLSLDTLRTLPVPLEMERLARSEIDSIEQSYNDRSPSPWEFIEPLLPGEKVAYEDMIIDHLDRIWLKLTRQTEWQDWLILSNDGTPQKIVQLPKEGMLTHVSEHHLGFRENDFTFSLYEAVD